MLDLIFFFVLQKKKHEDQKPLEEKIKVLKKRNAELASIARRLEDKAKTLQQENAKNRTVSVVFRCPRCHMYGCTITWIADCRLALGSLK